MIISHKCVSPLNLYRYNVDSRSCNISKHVSTSASTCAAPLSVCLCVLLSITQWYDWLERAMVPKLPVTAKAAVLSAQSVYHPEFVCQQSLSLLTQKPGPG